VHYENKARFCQEQKTISPGRRIASVRGRQIGYAGLAPRAAMRAPRMKRTGSRP
jgi:hypothetical protein